MILIKKRNLYFFKLIFFKLIKAGKHNWIFFELHINMTFNRNIYIKLTIFSLKFKLVAACTTILSGWNR